MSVRPAGRGLPPRALHPRPGPAAPGDRRLVIRASGATWRWRTVAAARPRGARSTAGRRRSAPTPRWSRRCHRGRRRSPGRSRRAMRARAPGPAPTSPRLGPSPTGGSRTRRGRTAARRPRLPEPRSAIPPRTRPSSTIHQSAPGLACSRPTQVRNPSSSPTSSWAVIPKPSSCTPGPHSACASAHASYNAVCGLTNSSMSKYHNEAGRWRSPRAGPTAVASGVAHATRADCGP